MPVFTQDGDDARLLIGRELCKDLRMLGLAGKLFIVHRGDVLAKQHVVDFESHLLADGARDLLVVAGENLGRNAVLPQRLDGVGRGLLGRIEEGEVAHEDHVAFVGCTKGAHRGGVGLLGDGEYAEAVAVELGDCGQNAIAQLVIECTNFSVYLGKRADGEHFFHGSFGDHLNLAASVAHYGGKTTAREIEGYFVDLHICFGEVGETRVAQLLFLRALDDRQVHEVLIARLEIAVEVGMPKHARIFLAVDVPVVLQHHLVLRERAGFVGAQHVHGAKVLNRVEVLDDGLLLAHRDRALGQTGGHDHGEHLGGEAHGDADGEQPCLEPIPLGDAVDHEYEGNHYHHELDKDLGNAVYALGEACLHGLVGEVRRHRAKERAVAHAKGKRGGAARNNAAAHEGDVFVRGCRVGRLAACGDLLDRFALARQARLTYKEVLGLDDSHVGGNHVACREMDDVAHDHFVDGNLLARGSLSAHRRRGGDHVEELFGGIAAASLLDVAKGAGEDHHGGDDDHGERIEVFRRVAHEGEGGEEHVGDRRDDGQEEQDCRERVHKRVCKPACQRFFLSAGDDVAAVLGPACQDFFLGEAPEVRSRPGHDFGEGARCRIRNAVLGLVLCLIEAVLILLNTAGGAAALLHGLQCACFPFSWLECRTGYSKEPARCCVCSCMCRPAAVVLSLSLKLLAPFRICDYLENRKAAEPGPWLDSCGFLAIR